MWRLIRHWRDWLMNEIVTPRRLAAQPQSLYFRSEKGGLTLENQPVPWSAEAVVVEAILRLPPAARRRSDFTLRVPGFEPIPADVLRADEAGQRHRLFFRFPVPKATGTAELVWRHHVLGKLEIPVVTPEQFLADLRLTLASAFVSISGRSVAAQTFVTAQQQGLSAAAVIQSPTGLAPLLDLGLSATFRTARGTKTVVTAVPLTASQLGGKEALVTALPPRLPRKAGEWTVTWTCPGRELATTRLRAVTPRAFRSSLRVSDTRFGVVTTDGQFRVVRQMPADGVAKAGPCFFVASREPGMAGRAEFEIGVQVPGADRSPTVLEQTVLVTDGPTPVAPGLIPMAELKHASAFELRIKGRVLGVLPLSPVPTATFTAEGGYKPPPEFTWSAAAEDELSERLARLMGAPPPEGG
jgi:hypothetical protein